MLKPDIQEFQIKRTKCIGSIDYEEECGATYTLQGGSSQVHLEGFIDVLVVQRSQNFLGSESVGGSDG